MSPRFLPTNKPQKHIYFIHVFLYLHVSGHKYVPVQQQKTGPAYLQSIDHDLYRKRVRILELSTTETDK